MSNDFLIRVRRERSNATPIDLEFGEVKFTDLDDRLHIGKADGSTASFGALSSVPWALLVNIPQTLSELGITLALTDLPDGYDYNRLQNRPDISALDELEDYPNLASFPSVGNSSKVYLDLATGLFYRWAAGQYHQLTGRAAVWGQISGDIETQADLKARFDAQQVQINALAAAIENQKIKVGDLYFSSDASNPALKLGYGTWEAYAEGRAIVGVDANDTDFNAPGKLLGEKEVTLTTDEMPEHGHDASFWNGSGSGRYNVVPDLSGLGGTVAGHGEVAQPVGGGQPHNNVQPSITVHCWKRTA
ncbi:MAG: hypothetical protein AAF609_12635 [Cyanobacteria bacterium P01_C01_bin.120]